jgi:hypothetical protein
VNNKPQYFNKIKESRTFYLFLLLIGFALYLGQSIFFSIHLDVTMDEGTYLIKGLFLARGDYSPFQDYGFWMNKMPFAFLFPGAIQYLFGAGLRTGRLFAVVLNFMLLLGLWLTARKCVEKWWALAVVWVSVLNSGLITYYVTATTQVLAAVFLIWSMYFLVSKKCSMRHLIIGVFLSCIVVLIRQNMITILPLIVLYLFWKQGKKAGWASLIVCGVVIGGFHIYYWPNIMRIWAPWMPSAMTRLFLGEEFLQGFFSQNVNPMDLGFLSRAFAFVESLRIHYFLMAGSLLALVFWPPRKQWKSDGHFKDAVFTGSVFVSMTFAHLWASVLQDACVFCYSGYIAFFSPAGLIFVALALQSGLKRTARWREWLGAVLFAVYTFGFGYACYHDLLNWVVDIPFFRIKNMTILPGQIEIWRLLNNKFGWAYDVLERVLPAFFALAIFVLILLVITLVMRKDRNENRSFSGIWLTGIVVLSIGIFLSPFIIPGGGKNEEVCGESMISGYEHVGKTLSELIPSESLVYWENQTSPLPLLYLNNVKIFPAQMNQSFNHLKGENGDLINRYGYWNDDLAAQWRQQADYLLIEDELLPGIEERGEIGQDFKQIAVTEPIAACRPYSAIYIYKKITQ